VVQSLRRWRKANNLTQSEAARRVQTTRQAWWAWEHGRRVPSPPMMRAVIAATDGAVQAGDFFSADGADKQVSDFPSPAPQCGENPKQALTEPAAASG
jgi:transcriptional regulator with XRE-family HTH domain